MDNCVFCKIVNGEIPSAKVWEDENFLAFLDIKPSTKGMTLVVPKKHFDSYIFQAPEEEVMTLFKAAKKVAGMLEKAFDIDRVAMVAEGIGVNHLHVKLYPLHGVKGKFIPKEPKENMYFEKYEGFVSTQLGPQIDYGELNKLAEQIRKTNE